MSFLDQFRKMRDSDLHDHWKSITTEAQLQAALDESFEKPVVLFKHSTTCGISAGAKYRLEQDWDFDETELSFYYLDLLSYRSISNIIAETLSVTHQSPQVIVVRDGAVVFDTSHHAINTKALKNVIT